MDFDRNGARHTSLSLLLVAIVGILLFLLALAANPHALEHSDRESLLSVSLVQLLIEPEKYSEQRVHVVGYMDDVRRSLYLTRDHAGVGDSASAILVLDDTPDAEIYLSGCPGNYVSIEGRVHLFEGVRWSIYEITRVVNLEKPEACWSRHD